MRILQIIDEPWDSGISHYALTLGLGLKRKGHEIHVWALPDKSPYRRAAELGMRPFPCAHPWLRWRQLRRYLSQHRIELVNAHTGSGHTLAVALTRGGPPTTVVRTRGDSRSLKAKPGFSLLYRNTDGFIAANASIQQQFNSLYPRLLIPTETIYQGLDRDSNAGDREKFPPLPFSPTPLVRIGIVARLDPVKGHEDFLRAAATVSSRHPDAEFFVAGREQNIRISQLRLLAETMSLGKSVHFLGHVSRVQTLMQTCDIGVIASRGSEAVCRVALEWMACEKPLVATRAGSVSELVQDGRTGFLVPPSDPAALADRMLTLANSARLRKEMGLNAGKRFEEHFTLERFADRTEAFYGRLKTPAGGSPPEGTDGPRSSAQGAGVP